MNCKRHKKENNRLKFYSNKVMLCDVWGLTYDLINILNRFKQCNNFILLKYLKSFISYVKSIDDRIKTKANNESLNLS